VIAALAGLLAAACDRAYDVTIWFDDATARESARGVELLLAPSCLDELPAGAERLGAFRVGETPSLAGARPGRHGLYARVRDDRCAVIAQGCAPVTLEAGGSGTLVVTVAGVASGAGCEAGEACSDGLCVDDAVTACDDDCTGDRGCFLGSCHERCVLGWCLSAPDGGFCRDGFCVDCLSDDDCGGSRYECDDATSACVEGDVDTTVTRFGIFYSTWHCVAAADNPDGDPVYDISEALEGRQSWGPFGAFHWWDEPEAGYYCLARNDFLLERHAILLRDAGVDFVFLDASRHAYVDGRSDRTQETILEPVERLLAVWSGIEGAPRVVPWVPVPSATTDPETYTVDALLELLGEYPAMRFEYLGRPLILVTENSAFAANEARLAELAAAYTVRRLWGVYADSGPAWSFLQPCEQDPTEPEPCDQRAAVLQGEVEEISISAAYQETFMSLPNATPKLRGLTFRRQFETLLLNPDTPIALISAWNEWIERRTPCGENPACPCDIYPSGCFIDLYDVERSRDLEPGRNEMGDYYYRLLADCIALFRSGRMCEAATADNLY
jgi:hypothetical protein